MFIPSDLIMVDAEMTGVNPNRDQLLQVAMLKLKWDGSEYKINKNMLVEYLSCEKQPETDFHKKYLTHIFKKCNDSKLTGSEFKNRIHEWLGPLKGCTMAVGDCIMTDLEFLLHNDCIDRPDIDKSGTPIAGTFHYESFDMNPLKLLAFHKLGEKKKPKQLRGEHDALVDCINQTAELNFVLKQLLS